MKRILVPTDFSETSVKVCEYAVNILGSEEAVINLFHILPDSVMVPDSSFPAGMDTDAFLNGEYLSGLKDQAAINIAKLKSEVLDYMLKQGYGNIKIETFIRSGDSEWEIMEICTSLRPDMVVMGTRGSGNKGFLEGSMAEKIMSKVNIPVIAVPNDSNYSIPSNIMYATSFNEKDFMKIKLLFRLFINLEVTIYVTHFEINDKKQISTEKITDLSQAFEDERSKGKIFFNCIDSEDKSVSLRTFCEEYNIDMISFISHKSNIFKNLFTSKIHKKDIFKQNLPMLAVHE